MNYSPKKPKPRPRPKFGLHVPKDVRLKGSLTPTTNSDLPIEPADCDDRTSYPHPHETVT